MSKKTDILDAIVAILEGVTSLKSVNWEKIKLTADDFKEYELPAAQIFSGGETIIHEQGRARKTCAALDFNVLPLLSSCSCGANAPLHQ